MDLFSTLFPRVLEPEEKKRFWSDVPKALLNKIASTLRARLRVTRLSAPQITEEKCWANIPSDLLNIIRSKLQTKDRIRLAATCRSYRTTSIIDWVPLPLTLSPCLFHSDDYRFHHPICSVTTKIELEVGGSYIRDFNFGWFLMTQAYMTHSATRVFFYNPETRDRITVPELQNPRFDCNLMFTSPPTSADCQIIGISALQDYQNYNVGVCTIKRHEESWTVVQNSRLPRFFSGFSSCKPMLFKGAYYCLGPKGNVMQFDPTTDKCIFETRSSNKPSKKVVPKLLRKQNTRRYMVEADGELLSVFVNHEGGSVGVFKLNVDEMEFDERVLNIGNKMLYVSYQKCYSETATVEGTENKIYLPQFHDKHSLFYSLDTNKFHTYTGFCTGDLYNVKTYDRSIWIKPVFDSKCVQAFEW